ASRRAPRRLAARASRGTRPTRPHLSCVVTRADPYVRHRSAFVLTRAHATANWLSGARSRCGPRPRSGRLPALSARLRRRAREREHQYVVGKRIAIARDRAHAAQGETSHAKFTASACSFAALTEARVLGEEVIRGHGKRCRHVAGGFTQSDL